MDKKRFTVGLSCVLGLAFGCGSNDEDKISLVPVSGKVLLDGKPLEGVTISFLADPSNKPSTDGGDVTGSGGTFSAKYRNRGGLAAGRYKIVVSRPKEGAAGKQALPSEITQSPYMANLAQESAAGKGKGAKPWPYSDGATTPLNHEVSPKGDTDLEFDLKSSAK